MSSPPVAITTGPHPPPRHPSLPSSRYRHLGPAAPVPGGLGMAGRVITGLVQVACLVTAVVVVTVTLRRRRFRLLAGLAANQARGGHSGRPAAVRQGPGLGPARRRPAVPGVPDGAAAACRRHPARRVAPARGRASGPSRIDGRTGRGIRTWIRPGRPGRTSCTGPASRTCPRGRPCPPYSFTARPPTGCPAGTPGTCSSAWATYCCAYSGPERPARTSSAVASTTSPSATPPATSSGRWAPT